LLGQRQQRLWLFCRRLLLFYRLRQQMTVLLEFLFELALCLLVLPALLYLVLLEPLLLELGLLELEPVALF